MDKLLGMKLTEERFEVALLLELLIRDIVLLFLNDIFQSGKVIGSLFLLQ